MIPGKGHLDQEEEDEEFVTRKDVTGRANNPKDGKNSEKSSATRSKHSVTEQRRRSKINERFQILRELIPHSDQKRDTASFLLEVIQYVQFLQEKVQKYEGSYQPWSSEPTKLMSWRNSHWRVQNLFGQPQALNNGSGTGSPFPGRFDENSIAVPTSIQQNPIDADHGRDLPSRTIDQTGLPSKAMGIPMPLHPVSAANDGAFSRTMHGQPSASPSMEYPGATEALNCQEEFTIERGTVSISSVYSEALLNSLTRALESTGVDLSEASISVQINLGKQADRGSNAGTSIARDHCIHMPSGNQPVGTCQDTSNGEDLDEAQKRKRSE